MGDDLGELPTRDLVARTRADADALTAHRAQVETIRQRLGRRFAELILRGWTWRGIEHEFGIPRETAWRWASEHL